MMREPLLKVYGHVYPISDAFYADLDAACADALADDADEPVLCRGQVVESNSQVLAALARHLRPEHQGKLDVLDLENWRLTRHLFDQGRIRSSSAPLNNVLDYSGH